MVGNHHYKGNGHVSISKMITSSWTFAKMLVFKIIFKLGEFS